MFTYLSHKERGEKSLTNFLDGSFSHDLDLFGFRAWQTLTQSCAFRQLAWKTPKKKHTHLFGEDFISSLPPPNPKSQRKIWSYQAQRSEFVASDDESWIILDIWMCLYMPNVKINWMPFMIVFCNASFFTFYRFTPNDEFLRSIVMKINKS